MSDTQNNLKRDKPKAGKIPTSPSGIKTMKKEKWDALWHWEAENYPQELHKIVTAIPMKEYYQLGLCCISHEISIAEFLRTAMRDNLKNIGKFAKVIKKNAKKKPHPNQGSLF